MSNWSVILQLDKFSFSGFLITSTCCSKVRALHFFGGNLSIYNYFYIFQIRLCYVLCKGKINRNSHQRN
jgi:hypothetical protein